MGRASAGGFLKLDLSDSVGDCPDKQDGPLIMRIDPNKRACGNLEEKRHILWITPGCE
jgi:hypothetical protein